MPSIRDRLKSSIKSLLKSRNLRLGNYAVVTAALEQFGAQGQFVKRLRVAQEFPEVFYGKRLASIESAQSQLGQDILALGYIGCERPGFFVEFGAADGMHLSNTYILEKEFGWSGIVAEPARVWHSALSKNRRCHIETACVWKETGATVEFVEADAAELSTISEFAHGDMHAATRRAGTSYQVPTLSLTDLLAKYNAPPVVDFLSIDTEGSEFDILSSVDFGRQKFRLIAVEHNFTERREAIRALLTSNGYRPIFPDLSDIDDWYVLAEEL